MSHFLNWSYKSSTAFNNIMLIDREKRNQKKNTHPACSLKHFEVQWISRQLAFYFGKGVAGGHASYEMGFNKILLGGISLWLVKTGNEEVGGE